MSKILGLDLGTNSIGWAVIDRNIDKLDYGVRVFDNRAVKQKQPIQKRLKKKKIKISFKLMLSSILTTTLFSLALMNIQNWQYWISLGIGGLLVVISVGKDK